jgi:hypothetical protein
LGPIHGFVLFGFGLVLAAGEIGLERRGPFIKFLLFLMVFGHGGGILIDFMSNESLYFIN